MNLELELAQVLLEDTRLLVTQERFRSAVSRAYYAAYHACIALMEGFGRRPQNYIGRSGRPAGRWEHGIITSQVVADAQLLDILTRPVALQLRWQYLQRIRGDYRAHETISARSAQISLDLAERIITTVERYLHA